MQREVVDPVRNERGDEEHPAWGLIGASRVTSTPGAVLFDSDVKHQHYVTVRLSTVSRRRDLHRDWLYPEREIVEVAMSEAQWASFVSSMNAGQGVPCTWLHRDREQMPEMPFEPRLAESMDEVRGAADEAAAQVAEAFAAYKAQKNVGNLRHLEAMIANMPANITFAAKSLNEHAENVVQRARADIEAMVVAKAESLGIEPGDLGVSVGQLTAGNDDDDEGQLRPVEN